MYASRRLMSLSICDLATRFTPKYCHRIVIEVVKLCRMVILRVRLTLRFWQEGVLDDIMEIGRHILFFCSSNIARLLANSISSSIPETLRNSLGLWLLEMPMSFELLPGVLVSCA